MPAHETAVDLQIVVGCAAYDYAPDAQHAFLDGASVGRDEQAAMDRVAVVSWNSTRRGRRLGQARSAGTFICSALRAEYSTHCNSSMAC